MTTFSCQFKKYARGCKLFPNPFEQKPARCRLIAIRVLQAELSAGHGPDKVPNDRVGPCRAGTGPHLLLPLPRPYGKDVPRLDYWLAYETIMKKVGGRPHWAKVGCHESTGILREGGGGGGGGG